MSPELSFLGTVFTDAEEARIFRRGLPVTVTIMDDLEDTENENNISFQTEQFSNRWEERKVDRLMPFSYEPQVLTDLIADGYKPNYPSRVTDSTSLRSFTNSLTPPQSAESK